MSDPTPNPAQRALIEGTDGVYVVDAGPGTGKTFTVTRRYATIVAQPDVEPDDVLLVTFTDSAATEMRERIVDHSDYSATTLADAPIQTFHAHCYDILREYGHAVPTRLGIDDRITGSTNIIDDDLVERELFREFLGRFREAHPEYADQFRALSEPLELLELITQLAAKGVFPTAEGWYRDGEAHLDGDYEAFKAWFDAVNQPRNDGRKQSELRAALSGFGHSKTYHPDAPAKAALRGGRGTKQLDDAVARRVFDEDRTQLKAFVHDVYHGYLRFALSRNYLNFGFLQLFAYVALCEDPQLRERAEFEYVMVDEFQDSSEIQFKLALLLSGTDNLCVVGDWKQSIYSFQYAAVENITDFEARLERFASELNDDHRRVDVDTTDVEPIELQENYRSTETVIDFSEEALVTPATDGADVVITPKGDGTAVQYLRTHYAREGSLEGVYYFDCAETLPALSVFDIRPQLEAGIDREQAVENVVGHYTEILAGFMGRQRYEQAVRSPDIIHYLVKALFDPVHGADAFSHRDLKRAASRMHETRDAPPVSDADLRADLQGVAANSKRSFDELMQGVANRIEKATRDRRLATLFNHVAEAPQEAQAGTAADGGTTDTTDSDDRDLAATDAADEPAETDHRPEYGREPPDTPRFDFGAHLDEDCLIVLDTSGYRPDAQRMLTLVLLSKLWTALKRRAASTPPDQDLPLVNCVVEEAADVAPAGVLADMLSKGRSLGLGVTLSMQFPRQIREDHPQVFWELLNDVETVVTGPVGVAPKLAERMATADRPADEVGNRLRALDRGEWLVRLAAPFDAEAPPPFKGQSPALPAGHPDGPQPFDDHQQELFDAAHTRVKATTRSYHGLDVTGDGTSEAGDSTDRDRPTAAVDDTDAPPVDRTLAYTQRLPDCVHYDSRADAVVCDSCETRYGAHTEGLRRAIECCHDLADVDRDDLPISSVDLTLTPAEREQSEYTDRQLVFLQTVYDAHQQRFDPDLEYDIVWDSMVRLQEYTGIDQDAVDELRESDVLAKDCTYPHTLYTVTSDGRDELNVGHRAGVAHGHKQGDLSESSLHVMMVEVLRRYFGEAFADDPGHPAVEIVTYYEQDGHRYDVVGLDEDGEIVVVGEAERSNHDTLEAVPDDYDKMAAVEPTEAIWVVKNREAAHEILQALNDSGDGDPRVSKTYSETMAPQEFTIDTPGLTDIFTVQYVRDSLLDETAPE